MQNTHKRTNVKLYLIIMISIFPILVGGFLYHYHQYFHFKTLNHGVLINPPIHEQDLGMTTTNNKKLWQIVYVPSNCCDSECEKNMFVLHQLRKVLGKDGDRVGLTLVTNQACQSPNAHDFQKIVFSQHQYIKLNTLLPKNENSNRKEIANKIYLVDPNGNLFMSYNSSDDAMGIYTDLKRVLGVSQIG